MKHPAIDNETIEKLSFILKHQSEVSLSDWERDLIVDRKNAVKDYGISARCTNAQKIKITEIYNRIYVAITPVMENGSC